MAAAGRRPIAGRSRDPLPSPWAATPQAAPLGMRAKGSVRSRNTVLVAGIAALIAGDLCFGFFPSVLGELRCRLPAGCLLHRPVCCCIGREASQATPPCRGCVAVWLRAPPRDPHAPHGAAAAVGAGMVLGSTFVGLHMAATQGVLFGMLAACEWPFLSFSPLANTRAQPGMLGTLPLHAVWRERPACVSLYLLTLPIRPTYPRPTKPRAVQSSPAKRCRAWGASAVPSGPSPTSCWVRGCSHG